jgi:hypothetical protein
MALQFAVETGTKVVSGKSSSDTTLCDSVIVSDAIPYSVELVVTDKVLGDISELIYAPTDE